MAVKPITRTSLAVVVALLVFPSTGLAASYGGKTSQRGGKVAFKTARGEVSSFRVTASWRCSDGERFKNTATIRPSMRISRRGTFGGRHKNRRYPGAGAARVRGRVAGRRARGTFTASLRFTGDTPDPKGTALCTTGRIRWSARRRR